MTMHIKGRRWYGRAHLSRGISHDDIAKIYDLVLQLNKPGEPGVQREAGIQSIFALVHKGKKVTRLKRNPIKPEDDNNFVAGSPLAKQSRAMQEAKRIFGLWGHVEEDWGICRVGEMVKGEFKVYGEGPDFSAALTDAEKKLGDKFPKAKR